MSITARHILFLLGDVQLARNDNHERLPAGFRRAGWRVTELPHDALRIDAGRLRAGEHALEAFDLIWPLGFGRQATFLDRMQLLRQIDDARFAVGPDALTYLHGKYRWLEHMPETHASTDIEALVAVVARGGEWVVKPPAGSYGRDVARVCSPADGRAAIARVTAANDGGYCVLQRYAPEIEAGEKRALVAGGRLIGSYLRRARGGSLTNLAAGGAAEPTSLTAVETDLVLGIAAELADNDVGFAAVDIAYPYLMEVNLTNPGGLGTMAELHGMDLTGSVVSAILAWRGLT